jgi:hypothetical protein
MKKQGSDIAHKEHYSNKNENKMFETLQNVLTQQPVLKRKKKLNNKSSKI